MSCYCPWDVRGSICRHAIKVGWLYFSTRDSCTLLDNDAGPSSLNAPPEISRNEPSHVVDAKNILMATDNVDHDVDALQLSREKLFGYFQLIQNSPPVTLSKNEQMIGLVQKMLDEANNIQILDYDFSLGLGAYESSLKRKKSFLSPKKKNKERKQNSGLDIDMNVHPSEYEPYQFQYLNKRGRPQSHNASSIAVGEFHRIKRCMCLE